MSQAESVGNTDRDRAAGLHWSRESGGEATGAAVRFWTAWSQADSKLLWAPS